MQSIHFRTMEKCLIRGGRGHQEREERGCVLPWNITYFASSERGFLKMPQALGRGESRSCILEFQGQKRGPDRQRLCAAMQFGKSGRDRLQPGGTPWVEGSGKADPTLGASQGRSGAAWSSSEMICWPLATPFLFHLWDLPRTLGTQSQLTGRFQGKSTLPTSQGK